MSEPRQKMLLEPPEESDAFFEAAKEGRLVIQRCTSCGEHQFYPRKLCIHCGEGKVEWIDASGRGTVHTFTVIHRGIPGWVEDGPYVAAVIDLDEGVRMTSNVIGCAPSDVEIGMAVEAVFVDEGALVVPRFQPVG